MSRQLTAPRLAAFEVGCLLVFTLLLALACHEAKANAYWLNRSSPSPNYSVGRAGNEPGDRFLSPYYQVVPDTLVAGPCGGMASDGHYLYWAEPRNDHGYINRLDTSTEPPTLQRPFITSPEPSVCGVTVDIGHIYWGSGIALSRAKLDGSSVEPYWALTTPNPSEPWRGSQVNCGLTVDNSYLYWADSQAGWIGRARLSDGYPEPSWINSSAGEQNPCGLAVTSSHIYWTAARTGQILSANLDGTNPSVLVSGLSNPCGLTVHGSHLYWINGDLAHMATIGRANLDGSVIEPAVVGTSATIHKSCSIAVDDQLMPSSSTPEPTSESEGGSGQLDTSQTPSVTSAAPNSSQGRGAAGSSSQRLLGRVSVCQRGWLRLRVRGNQPAVRVRLSRRQLQAGRVLVLARHHRQRRWLAIRGRVGHGKLSRGLWRIRAVYLPRHRQTYSRCHSSHRVFVGKRHRAERRLQLRAGMKHCGPTPPFTSVSARAASCRRAKAVVRQWSHTHGCGPDGSTCHVSGWACVVPRRDNSSQLECRRRRQLIRARLGYY